MLQVHSFALSSVRLVSLMAASVCQHVPTYASLPSVHCPAFGRNPWHKLEGQVDLTAELPTWQAQGWALARKTKKPKADFTVSVFIENAGWVKLLSSLLPLG